MLRLDIFKFAALISWLTDRFGEPMTEKDADTILKMSTDMIDIPVTMEIIVADMFTKHQFPHDTPSGFSADSRSTESQPPAPKPTPSELNTFLNAMVGDTREKIIAIKRYRALTGSGLLEAKNTVEYYWNRLYPPQ